MLKKSVCIFILLSILLCSSISVALADSAYLPGDVDGDGEITTTDFLKIKKHFLGDSVLTGNAFDRADYNEDGLVNSTDYLNIKVNWVKKADISESIVDPEKNEVVQNNKAITLYVPNSSYDGFKTYRATFDGTIHGIISKLASFGVFSDDVAVNSFEIADNTAKIDFNSEFGVSLEHARANEYVFWGSLANTIIEYYGVDYLSFTVEGEIFETGLTVYDFPVEYQQLVTIYVSSEIRKEFIPVKTCFNGTIEGLIEKLVDFASIPEGTKIISFEINGDTAKLDLSKEFGIGLNEARASENKITGALANTIINHYGVKYVTFTVGGEILETGLTVYDFPIEFQKCISVYIPNADNDDFEIIDTYFDDTINGLISKFIDFELLPEGTKVISFGTLGDMAKIDLSKEFGIAVNEARTKENMLLGSVANTIIKHYNVKYVTFTVEGKILETGLNVYDSPVGFQKPITIYAPNADKTDFRKTETFYDGTIDGIISKLASFGVFTENVKVNSFVISEDTAKIDLSKEFGIAVNEARGGEGLVVGSLANTIIKHYGIKYITFTVEGKTLETGLTVYDSPIGFQQLLSIYTPNVDKTDFNVVETYFDGTKESFVSKLLDFGVLPEGTEVNSFVISEDTAKIDLSKEFGIAVNEARGGEKIVVGAFANTIIDCFGIKYVTFTIEGEILETGLSVYDYPIGYTSI